MMDHHSQNGDPDSPNSGHSMSHVLLETMKTASQVSTQM